MAVVKPGYYTNPDLVHIKEVDQFFKVDPQTHSMTFIGETLEVRVQKRYEVYDLLEIADTVKTLGLMDLIINDKYHASLSMLAFIEMDPSDIEEKTFDSIPYVILHFVKNDIFMMNTQVVQNQSIIYAVYMEIISRGKVPYWFTYEDIANVYDRVHQMTGSGIGVDRVVFELVVSHLARNRDNLFKQYRYAKDGASMQFIPIKSVAYAPTSTTARLAGSYFDDGLSASLLVRNDRNQPLEDLYRGLPLSYAGEGQTPEDITS